MDLNRAGIYANPKKDTDLNGAAMVAQLLRARGVAVSFDAEGMPPGETDVIDHAQIDVLFVLGGDGTLLKAAEKCSPFDVPMLGINLGRMGFLAEVEACGIEAAIDAVRDGHCKVEDRLMLHFSVYRGEELLLRGDALNDVVVLKKDVSRMINVELSINGALADRVSCDGMLVATPTGSTGYSLSAGGPIVCPRLECLLATPVCAHSLHSRSIVASAEDTLVMKPYASGGAVLTADGTVQREMGDGDEVRVRKSAYVARFIRFKENYFYPLLRSKFINWDRFV
jgi:NAD+ kinase